MRGRREEERVAKKLKITACTIVKNEAENIGAWLKNMHAFADEVLVVDTGSTDGTQDIVKKSGAKLYSFPWRNDFAAAKNFAIGKAHGQWIVFCDADETFTEKSLPHIRPLLARLDPVRTVAAICCRLVNVDPGNFNRFIGASVQIRLFRNIPRLRYIGAVHEALNIPKNMTAELTRELTIRHTGYAAKKVKAKLARNLTLLQEKIAGQDGHPTPHDEAYLMDCYYGLGEAEKAAEYARLALSHIKSIPSLEVHVLTILAMTLAGLRRPREEVMAVFARARELCPEVADFPALCGAYLFDTGDYLAAEPELLRALSLHKEQKLSLEGVRDSFERFLPKIYLLLGRLSELRGEREQAEAFYLESLRVHPHEPAPLQRLVRALGRDGLPAAAIIELLNGIYDKDRDAVFLELALRGARAGEVYLYYAQRASGKEQGEDREEQELYAYLVAGKYDAAAIAAGERLDWLYRRGIEAAVAEKKPIGGSLALLLPEKYRALWQERERKQV